MSERRREEESSERRATVKIKIPVIWGKNSIQIKFIIKNLAFLEIF